MKRLTVFRQGLAFRALLASAAILPVSSANGGWKQAGSLNESRTSHEATALADGRVLFTGGAHYLGDSTDYQLSSSELYDPAEGTWKKTGEMSIDRSGHSASLLPNGKVLVAGGVQAKEYDGDYPLATSELYDPVTGEWSAAAAMSVKRSDHTATILASGHVLVTGGYGDDTSGTSAEVHDPVAGTWTATGSLASERYSHTATLLKDGRVLVAGGNTGSVFHATAEIYNPESGTWTVTGSMAGKRSEHTASLLADGRVFVVGGAVDDKYLASAEIYDPASGAWISAGSMDFARSGHSASVLATGEVLVAGGNNSRYNDRFNYYKTHYLPHVEAYDPKKKVWRNISPLNGRRSGHSASVLGDGTVLVVGGGDFDDESGNSFVKAGAEIYTPDLVAPEIVSQTQGKRLAKGTRTTLRVKVSGSSPVFQWYLGKRGDVSRPIRKATSGTYKIRPLKKTTRYWVEVENLAGRDRSKTITIRAR